MKIHTPADQAPASQPPALPRGHRLPGFELQGELSADGVSDDCRSYRAWDLLLLRPVVVTEYLPAALARRGSDGEVVPASRELAPGYAAGLDHFLAQTRFLAQAGQPQLLRVLHLLLVHGTAYRVQPWYAGQPLQQLRRQMPGPPDEEVLRRLLVELLGALQVFHDVGAVHGAVHPGRILVLDDDSSLLLAPRTRGSASADPVADPFAAPELQSGAPEAPVGPWSDCCALARVARYCITGLWPAPPGEASSRPLLELVDELSAEHRAMRYTPALLQVLDLAAADDIASRPQSAGEFREWLDQGRPLHTPPIATDDVATRAVLSVIAALPPRAPAAERIELPPIGATSAGHAASAAAMADAAPAASPAPAASARTAPKSFPKAAAVVMLAVAGLSLAAVLGWIWWAPATWPSAEMSQAPPAGPAPEAAAWAGVAVPQPVVSAAATDFEALPAPAAGPASAASWPAALGQTPAPARDETPVRVAAAPAPAIAPAVAPAAGPAIKPPVKPPVKPAVSPPVKPAVKPSVKPPVKAETKPAGAPAATAARNLSPRERCGDRTPFSLYRCMQRECAGAGARQHPQCLELRRSDRVD